MAFWNPSSQSKPADEQSKICDDAEAMAGDVAILALLKQQAQQPEFKLPRQDAPDTPAV